MSVWNLLSDICAVASIALAAMSAYYWYKASVVPMPAKTPLPAELPGMGRVMIHGEDYSVTLARLNEGVERLDIGMEAINLVSRLNAKGALFAMFTALTLSLGFLFTMIAKLA